MPKFYVESGDLQVVVEANSPIAAAGKALSWVTEEDILDPVVTVNERGFVRNRVQRDLQETDVILETGTLMCLIREHELE